MRLGPSSNYSGFSNSGYARANNKYGLAKSRKCLSCSREITDDGSLAYLRGFCTARCMENYLYGNAGK